jgi:hypothetical protein
MNLMHLNCGDQVVRRDGVVETFERWSPGETMAMFRSGLVVWISDGQEDGGKKGPRDIVSNVLKLDIPKEWFEAACEEDDGNCGAGDPAVLHEYARQLRAKQTPDNQ